jgi:hypothetical protein
VYAFSKDDLPEACSVSAGLMLLTDVGSAEYRAQYLGKARRHLHGYAFYRIALVEIQS